MSTEPSNEAYQALQQTWGLEFGRICTLISQLDTWHTQDQLVDAHGLSHRSVGQILTQLENWLEQDADRYRLAPQHFDSFRAEFKPQAQATDPHTAAAQTHPQLGQLRQILTTRPKPDHHLDHVAATPETLLKRALFIGATYDITAGEVLCLGDHDLTSLALALVDPGLAIAVVDIDERLLAFIDKIARERGWNIKTYFADFRLELPQSLATRFDLVFTDPPYSPAGVKLFLQRGIAALKDHPYARLLLAYGFGEQHPGLGYKVQTVLHELRLVSEAILPYFNHYHGARAIGAQSALYVLRPTRRSRPAAERIAAAANIYTHGRNSAAAAPEQADAQTPIHLAPQIAPDWQANETIIIGESWPQDVWPGAKRIDLATYLAACRSGDQPRSHNIALQLHPYFDSYCIRLLLTAQAESLLIVVHSRHSKLFDIDTPLHLLIGCKYRLVDKTAKQNVAWITLEKVPTPRASAAPFLLRYLADHAKARLGNAWREALISWHKSQGTNLSKNQARELISQSAMGSAYGQHYLTEMPIHLLFELAEEIELTVKD